jgi:hypothetical protein
MGLYGQLQIIQQDTVNLPYIMQHHVFMNVLLHSAGRTIPSELWRFHNCEGSCFGGPPL